MRVILPHNITNNPRFLADGTGIGNAHVPGNYRIKSTSPCLNAGANQDWMTDHLDLDGNPRIDHVFGTVDMGAYERVISGTTITIQ